MLVTVGEVDAFVDIVQWLMHCLSVTVFSCYFSQLIRVRSVQMIEDMVISFVSFANFDYSMVEEPVYSSLIKLSKFTVPTKVFHYL